jgi:hypothetical protein
MTVTTSSSARASAPPWRAASRRASTSLADAVPGPVAANCANIGALQASDADISVLPEDARFSADTTGRPVTNQTVRAPVAASRSVAPGASPPKVGSSASVRAAFSRSAAAAPTSACISRTSWPRSLSTSSRAALSVPGSGAAFAASCWGPLRVSVTAPSVETVTNARSAAFCSSMFAGSRDSSQTSRAK